MAQTVVGLFDNSSEAQQAVEQLVSSGFSRENIDVTSKGNSAGSPGNSSSRSTNLDAPGTGLSGDYTSGNFTGSSYAGKGSDALSTGTSSSDDRSSTFGSGYASGDDRSNMFGTGSSDNDNTSDYKGSAFGDDRSNTLGSSYSDNDNKSDHKGSAIGNFFRSLFGDDKEADTYSNVANKSGSIVTVHAKSSEEAEEAADILDDAGAVNVNERASEYGYTNSGDASADLTGNTDINTTDRDTKGSVDMTGNTGTSLPVIEEEFKVGKKMVETGGKRLRSRIVERSVEEDLRLREERVWVERNAVNRPATDADLANFQQTSIELVEHSEVPVIAKEARVVEEVSLGKEVDERVETIKDTVRSTEVDVEDIESKDTLKSSKDTGYNKSSNSDFK